MNALPRAHLLSLLGVIAALAALVAQHGFEAGFNWPTIRSDGEGYYAYLPALVLHGSADFSVLAPHYGGEIPRFTGILRNEETGRFGSIYPMGVALLQLPFFLATHGIVVATGAFPADGYSLPYQLGVLVAAFAYLCVGLWALSRYLSRFFARSSVLVTLVAIVFGTNLFHYAAYDAAWSHVYTFALVSLLVLATPRFWSSGSWTDAAALGALAGLLFLVRNYNLLYLALFFLPYGLVLVGRGRDRFLQRWRALVVAGGVALLVVAPQLILWKLNTGEFLTNSYRDTGLSFQFGAPHLAEVLFSFQSGLFVWAPALGVAVVGLVLAAWRSDRRELQMAARLALLAISAVALLIASWEMWHFGAGFGHRGFVDTLPLFAVGFATALDRAQRAAPRIAVAIALAVGIVVTDVQMLNYWNGKVPFGAVTREIYVQGLLSFPERALLPLARGRVRVRKPEHLRAQLSIDAPAEGSEVSAGGAAAVRVAATNAGEAHWLDAVPRYRGRVLIQTFWYTAADFDGCERPPEPPVLMGKVYLPEIVRPGETVTIEGTVQAPLAPGEYVLVFDLVSDTYASLSELGSAWLRCRRIRVR